MKPIVYKVLKFLPDRLFLDLQYYHSFHKFPNWNNPKTFNEKLQWLKLYNRKPEYTMMVDKYAVKDFVAGLIGEEHVIPTLGVWDKGEDIEWDKLPKQFVLKTTHAGGNNGVIICKDKDTFDKVSAIEKLNKSLKKDTYIYEREWPYKNVHRRIIAEQYMEDKKTQELRDYKFFCMDGVAKALFIATDRQKREEPYFDFFDTEFRHLDIQQGHPNAPVPPAKPESFEQMKVLAAKLSKGIPQARVDFYEVNGQAYFGEITFFHFGANVPFRPNTIDKEWGDWITLPDNQGGGAIY